MISGITKKKKIIKEREKKGERPETRDKHGIEN